MPPLHDYFARLRDWCQEVGPTPSLPLPTVPAGLSRRRFLGLVTAASTAAAIIDLDQLLWMPGEKTIFLPDLSVADFPTPTWITQEALKMLRAKLDLARHDLPCYDATASPVGNIVGNTVQIRIPRRFTTPAQFIDFGITDNTKPVTLTNQINCAIDVSDIAQMNGRQILARLEPAIDAIASGVIARKVNVFAELPLPKAGVDYAANVSDKHGLRLRAVQALVAGEVPGEWRTNLRFDVLGGRA